MNYEANIAVDRKEGRVNPTPPRGKQERVVLLIHSGCGSVRITPEQEVEYRTAILGSLKSGYNILKAGGSSLDAVSSAISFMEDGRHFNAGRACALNSKGFAEHSASIMDGKTRNSGAIAGSTIIKNPIQAAVRVLETCPPMSFAGPGADEFARREKLPIVNREYFITEERTAQLERVRKEAKPKGPLDPAHGILYSSGDGSGSDYAVKPHFFVHKDEAMPEVDEKEDASGDMDTNNDSGKRKASALGSNTAGDGTEVPLKKIAVQVGIGEEETEENKKYGTVGAVALDVHGNLASGSSTGGLTNQPYGRVADTPMVGCGVYANNNTCAVSCTGCGEFFIKSVLAHDISCMMEYSGMSLEEACTKAVMEKLNGRGAVIALDKDGNMAYPYNTRVLYRGSVTENGNFTVSIYKDSEEREQIYATELREALNLMV